MQINLLYLRIDDGKERFEMRTLTKEEINFLRRTSVEGNLISAPAKILRKCADAKEQGVRLELRRVFTEGGNYGMSFSFVISLGALEGIGEPRLIALYQVDSSETVRYEYPLNENVPLTDGSVFDIVVRASAYQRNVLRRSMFWWATLASLVILQFIYLYIYSGPKPPNDYGSVLFFVMIAATGGVIGWVISRLFVGLLWRVTPTLKAIRALTVS